jgi:anti-anti-sigma factor
MALERNAPSKYSVVPGLVARVLEEGSTTVITLRGEADLGTLPVLVEALARVVADHAGPVIVDLSETAFIDTAAVRALVCAGRLLADGDRVLAVRSPSRLAVLVLGVLGLSNLVEASATAA